MKNGKYGSFQTKSVFNLIISQLIRIILDCDSCKATEIADSVKIIITILNTVFS